MAIPKIKACGVLVVAGDPIRKFLLMIHPDRLDLPKGHMEKGETEIACALRELEEETGITERDIQLDPNFCFRTSYKVWPPRFKNQECDKTTVIFLGRLVRDVSIQLTEHTSFRWYDWSPPHQLQPETIDPLLKQLEEYLG